MKLVPLLLLALLNLTNACKTVIIGSGIGGAYTAFRLASPSVCLFEAKQRPGGRILTVKDPLPNFKGYTIDLGAYRFSRTSHRIVRKLVEDALNITTLCYTDPFESGQCPGGFRRLLSTRGRVLGKVKGRPFVKVLERYREFLPYVIKKRFRWGGEEKLESRRTVFGQVFGASSVIPELAKFPELMSETDYEKSMNIADDIIRSLRNGTYDGIPYSDISPLQIAYSEGLTTEELMLDFDDGFSNNFAVREPVSVILSRFIRAFAAGKDVEGQRGLVTPVERRGGVLRRIGMGTIVKALLNRALRSGVKVEYGKKAIGITRHGDELIVEFADGSTVKAEKVVLNIGKADLSALGMSSEPLKSSSKAFRRAVERNFVTGTSKTYCFWEDAWWLTKLNATLGRIRTPHEGTDSMRYHDGHVTCEDYEKLKGCRGGMLVSYSFGDFAGLGGGIHTHTHNLIPYTPLTNDDNVHTLIPGSMNGVEKVYFENIYTTVKNMHKRELAMMGMDVDEVIKKPSGCIFADWRDIGLHTEMSPGRGTDNSWALFVEPSRNIFLVNEAWGQTQGWAEGSLESAERALFHGFGVEKPKWLDDIYHTAVVKKFNQG